MRILKRAHAGAPALRRPVPGKCVGTSWGICWWPKKMNDNINLKAVSHEDKVVVALPVLLLHAVHCLQVENSAEFRILQEFGIIWSTSDSPPEYRTGNIILPGAKKSRKSSSGNHRIPSSIPFFRAPSRIRYSHQFQPTAK